MPEAETLAVGSPRPDRAPTPWLFLTSGVLVGALLGAMAAFLVVQAQQPDRAAEFMIDQRLKAYQAYADEVATANTLEDKAMAAVVSDLDAEDGDGPDPTGAKPEALAQERLRLDARMRDVDLLGSEPVRTAFRDNHQEQDEALAAVLSLYDGDDAPTTDDYRAVQRTILEVRGKRAPATLVLVIRDELAADR